MTEQTNYLLDMDGVLINGNHIIPGADKFIDALNSKNVEYLVFTNNPIYTPRDLAHKLHNMHINIQEKRIFTSAMATALFLSSQHPSGTAFVVGEHGLKQALHEVGYILTDTNPDYVVLGEPFGYSVDQITKAIRLISNGALFIATNPDAAGRTPEGLVPACGALASLIEKATGRSPFFVGKPNPLMMRNALNFMGWHSRNTVMVGDRMDTDVVAGIMSGLRTILVLSGISTNEDLKRFPYRPTQILNSVVDIKLPD